MSNPRISRRIDRIKSEQLLRAQLTVERRSEWRRGGVERTAVNVTDRVTVCVLIL